VEPEVAQRRAEILTQQQAEIATQLQNERIGHEIAVMVEEYDPYTDSYTGRSGADAPEIDNYVTFTSARNLQAGDVVNVEIFGVREDGLLGRAKP
jgi:ribosomal protein S12 methylthiotransferase